MVPPQPCFMLSRFSSKVLNSISLEDSTGSQLTFTRVFAPSSSNSTVDSVWSGQFGFQGWRVMPAFASEKELRKTRRSGERISL